MRLTIDEADNGFTVTHEKTFIEDGKTHTGTLLSGRGDIILRTPAGEVSVIQAASVREISFPELPDFPGDRGPPRRWVFTTPVSYRSPQN
jgi:hypothetical protein